MLYKMLCSLFKIKRLPLSVVPRTRGDLIQIAETLNKMGAVPGDSLPHLPVDPGCAEPNIARDAVFSWAEPDEWRGDQPIYALFFDESRDDKWQVALVGSIRSPVE